jgi:hypothetical protein
MTITNIPNLGKGWEVSHPHYGTWFISYESVLKDYKECLDDFDPITVKEIPSEDTIETWYREQITWIEFKRYGVQVNRPDMDLNFE